MEYLKHLLFPVIIALFCASIGLPASTQAATTITSGSLIKGQSSSTVYYVSSDNKRLIFLNEATFFTYYTSFDTVVTISDSDLATYPLGNPIAPKAGSLIKVQSVSKVYLVDGTLEAPVLRWITTEDIARTIYGTNWAQRVLDVPPTLWTVFSFGTDIDSIDDVPAEPLLTGFWGLNGFITDAGLADVRHRFNTSVFQVAADSPTYAVKTLLPIVQRSGMKVTLRMSSSISNLDTNGNFDINKWKNYVAAWKNSGVQTYIDNGTLIGHMLLDDILTFDGKNPTGAELDEMARYSEETLPGLMTFVRNRATTMPVPTDGTYDYLDAVVNQYIVRDGEINTYTKNETAAAQALHVASINGLNIADGGDGSSGQPGWRQGFYAMSAAEITEYSKILLSVPTMNLFLMWEYDGQERWSDGSIGSNYFDQQEFVDAISQIGR
ncbi:TPA: hypothetical protein DEP96_00060 [Candidatus Uhrbacteria bacterium]|nr:hypothetical protein [Candidatus Uhrbacteria bacterium]